MASIFLEGIGIDEFLTLITEKMESNSQNLIPTENKAIQQGSELITRKEASAILSISLPTLNTYSKLGYLKAYRLGTKQVRYKRSEVLQCLEELPNFKHRTHPV